MLYSLAEMGRMTFSYQSFENLEVILTLLAHSHPALDETPLF
jgi:hypothetical protein